METSSFRFSHKRPFRRHGCYRPAPGHARTGIHRPLVVTDAGLLSTEAYKNSRPPCSPASRIATGFCIPTCSPTPPRPTPGARPSWPWLRVATASSASAEAVHWTPPRSAASSSSSRRSSSPTTTGRPTGAGCYRSSPCPPPPVPAAKLAAAAWSPRTAPTARECTFTSNFSPAVFFSTRN